MIRFKPCEWEYRDSLRLATVVDCGDCYRWSVRSRRFGELLRGGES